MFIISDAEETNFRIYSFLFVSSLILEVEFKSLILEVLLPQFKSGREIQTRKSWCV